MLTQSTFSFLPMLYCGWDAYAGVFVFFFVWLAFSVRLSDSLLTSSPALALTNLLKKNLHQNHNPSPRMSHLCRWCSVVLRAQLSSLLLLHFSCIPQALQNVHVEHRTPKPNHHHGRNALGSKSHLFFVSCIVAFCIWHSNTEYSVASSNTGNKLSKSTDTPSDRHFAV